MKAFRRAWRQLLQHPGFSAAAVLTLAIGIGFNTSIFSVVNSLLFAPLKVEDPARLMAIYSGEPGDYLFSSPLASVDVEALGEESRTFSNIAAYTYTPLALEHGAENRLVLAARATHDFFELLGIETALGRGFSASLGPEEAVLSHTAWHRYFAADPGAVGKTLRLDGRQVAIVGVAPESFLGLSRGVAPEVWISFDTPLVSEDAETSRESRWLWAIGRLRAEASFEVATADVEALSRRLAERYPDSHGQRRFDAVPLQSVRILPGLDNKLQAASAVVMILVFLVLLIACANVAQLLLVRALDRRQEIATHLALGAGPGAILRRLLLEGLALSILGGLLGLAMALLFNRALNRLELPIPVTPELGLGVDPRVLVFTAAVVMLATLFFSLAPALEAARTDVASALRGSSGAPSSRRLGRSLIVAQVALSLLLLAAAGLMLRSLGNAQELELGFSSEDVAVATFKAPGDTESQDEFRRRLLDRINALPDVEAAGLTSHLPLTLEIRFSSVRIEGSRIEGTRIEGHDAGGSGAADSSWPQIDSASVGPGYFTAMKIPLRQGRGFEAQEDGRVVVVNQAFADRFWPTDEAIGQEIRLDGESARYRVVGIAANGKYRTLGGPQRPFLYRSLEQPAVGDRSGEITTGSLTLVARTRRSPETALPRIRAELRSLDPEVAIARLEPLEKTLALMLFLPRTGAFLFGLFSMAGVVLAAIGLAGVLHYGVRRRRREIGIRMALGADRSGILFLVLREGLLLTSAGLLIGSALTLLTTHVLAAWLYGVSPGDPLTLLTAGAILLLVTLGASYLPARRAANIHPAQCLRSTG